MKNLIFLHIPKAAGSTFIAILRNNFRDSICNLAIRDKQLDKQPFENLSPEEKGQLKMLAGHVFYGIHNEYPDPEQVRYITFLRHPVDRVLSHYYYARKEKKHYLYDEIVQNNYSLHDYLTRMKVREADNGQTRMISGIDPEYGRCTAEMLEIARKNLSRFDFAGIMEEFDKGLVLLKEKEILNSIYYLKGNENKFRKTAAAPDPSVIRLIEEQNRLDMELYAYCRDRFQAESQGLEMKLQLFRFANYLVKKYFSLKGS